MTGALIAAYCWLLLLPLGIVQVSAVAAMRAHLGRSWGGLTALAAVVAIAVGLGCGIFGENSRAMGRTVTMLGFLPTLPVAIDLARRRIWPMAIVSLLRPIVAGLLLQGVGRWAVP